MKKVSHYIWILRFLCILTLILALLFTRYIDKISRENKLAALAAEKSAASTAANLFVWQKEKAGYLQKLVAKLQTADGENAQELLSQAEGFSAFFVTDKDGVVINIFPEHYAEQMSGFLKIRKEQRLQPSILFLEDVFSAPALIIPYEKENNPYLLYAVLPKDSLALLISAQQGEVLTIVDSNDSIIASANPNFKTGMRFTELNHEYSALGGGFYQKGGSEPTLACRINTKGFFGWSVFSEITLNTWLYGYYPVYLALLWAIVMFAFSLYLAKFRARNLDATEKVLAAKERSEQLKARIQSIVEKDRE